MSNEERYREALETIVCMLEPLGWTCECSTCPGCEFEMQESLQIAMNVLAGLDSHAHYGPPHNRAEMRECSALPDGCERCQNHHPTSEEIDAAYAAVGFVKDGKMWRRGNAF